METQSMFTNIVVQIVIEGSLFQYELMISPQVCHTSNNGEIELPLWYVKCTLFPCTLQTLQVLRPQREGLPQVNTYHAFICKLYSMLQRQTHPHGGKKKESTIWYMVRCGSKNGHQKDICLKQIGLCAQNMVTVLGSIDNMI